MLDQALQRISERGSIRIQDRGVVESRGARRRCLAAFALPGVQADVVMVAPSGHKGGLGAVALGDLKPEHAAVKGQRALQVSHFQMHVANADSRMDGGIHHSKKGEV